MDLVNKKVMHETFGKGNVINYDDSYIKIKFESGDKRFIFPDAFGKYITFIDQKATKVVNKKMEKKEEQLRKEEEKRQEELRQEELLLEREKALEKERQYILKQKKLMKSGNVNAKVQSVFWCEEDEIEKIFTDWEVFTGEFKSGKKVGQPRLLARMNQNSACLLTKRDDNIPEKDRQILGLFMADEDFDGRLCEDGYIKAHPKYRIELSEKESEKMLFWNYYADDKSSDKTIWNSGRQRYFDNLWTAQILRDILALKEDPKEQKEVQDFLEYFCKINLIDIEDLPKPEGALMNI